MKIFKLILIFIFFNINCFGQKVSSDKIEKERVKLKNYAFCQCLRHVYIDQDSLFLIDGSIGGYFETGAYGLHVYDIIDSVAFIFSQKKYLSKDNKCKLGLMKCLDFYNSLYLDSLVKKLDNQINPETIKFIYN
jgi:hypothetical protein